jgi:acetyl-CoA carboxylase biotin carboxyl carrier protein
MAAKRTTASARKGDRKTAREATPEVGLPGPDAVEQIQRLIEVMIRSGAVEVELQDEGQKIRVRLKEEAPRGSIGASPSASAPAIDPSAPESTAASLASPGDPAEGQELFKSPMVGTFYLSSAPDAEPFIQAGDQTDEDTTLCIIEAMKVMNEIKAEREFKIIDILAQNGEPVEFGQPLFLVTT